jgi:hypothetical protein
MLDFYDFEARMCLQLGWKPAAGNNQAPAFEWIDLLVK